MNVVAGAVLAVPDDQQKAAPLGLFVLLLLGVACYFLFRSMSRHLRRVRDQFPAGSTALGSPASGPPAAGSASGAAASSTVGAAPPARTMPGLSPKSPLEDSNAPDRTD